MNEHRWRFADDGAKIIVSGRHTVTSSERVAGHLWTLPAVGHIKALPTETYCYRSRLLRYVACS